VIVFFILCILYRHLRSPDFIIDIFYYRLVCDLSDIKSAVILSIFLSICPVTHISATVTPIGVKVCVTVDLSS